MTTSNPYHSINQAIRSRCQLFELEPLEEKDIIKGLKKATKSEYLEGIKINNKTIEFIAKLSGNDLRYAYNLLEIAFYSSDTVEVTIEKIKEINNKPVFFLIKMVMDIMMYYLDFKSQLEVVMLMLLFII